MQKEHIKKTRNEDREKLIDWMLAIDLDPVEVILDRYIRPLEPLFVLTSKHLETKKGD